ncbi:c-type cytochrome [Erythrobacter rubeus]|uniref:Cytochrome c n=1 Tax=Erythrobacter rubeus TaxID=2760803 RepID=A0ABR8KLN0_9SPHN|nr:cytochrome c [Erythrobacter rubeus]MBD2841343.1 cytochrome c [Erythrobacter rubeus]
MTRFHTVRISAVAASLAVLAACGGNAETEAEETVAAASGEPAVIEERQENYEAIGDAFKAIRGQLESGEPDFAAIEASATEINERAQRIPDYFPAGTSVDEGYDTEALAVIWEEPAEFETAAQNFIDASAQLVTVAASGDAAAVGEQAKEMGGTCKACHDKFRLETD